MPKTLKLRKPAREIDPTRTVTLRKAFETAIIKRMNLLKRDITRLIVTQDALGLKGVHNQKKLSSTQINLPELNDELTALHKQIDPADMIKLEEEAHVTVRYGLHTTDVEDVVSTVRGFGDIKLRIGNLSLFSNEKQDVLKFDVHSNDLIRMNRLLGELPNTQTQENYQPHLTVAYLKPGTGARYLDLYTGDLTAQRLIAKGVYFSTPERDQTRMALNVYCPTGEGGGIDPTCSPGGVSAAVRDWAEKLFDNPEHVENFIRWFGKSKVVDDGGHPLVVYHGTTTDFHEFDPERSSESQTAVYGHGFYFTPDPSFAGYITARSESGSRTLPVYLSLQNPKIIDADATPPGVFDPSGTRQAIEEEGHDGVVVVADGSIVEVVAFRSQQVKSATGNTGEFSFDNPDIRNVANAGRWEGQPADRQLQSFEAWMMRQTNLRIVGVTQEQITDNFWEQYIQQGWRQGAGRSFDDVNELGVGAGAKDQFLRQIWQQPVTREKVEFLASRVFTELKGFSASMSHQVSRRLADGLVQGLSPLELARSLHEVVGISVNRAKAIARTEIIRAHAEGQLDSFEAMGIEELGVNAEIRTAGDNKVCPICHDLAGPDDDPHVYTIEEARGLIPAHPMCRCGWKASDREIQNYRRNRISNFFKKPRLSKSYIKNAEEEMALSDDVKGLTSEVRNLISAITPLVQNNCGTGAGGFQPGNTCAKGGDGSSPAELRSGERQPSDDAIDNAGDDQFDLMREYHNTNDKTALEYLVDHRFSGTVAQRIAAEDNINDKLKFDEQGYVELHRGEGSEVTTGRFHRNVIAAALPWEGEVIVIQDGSAKSWSTDRRWAERFAAYPGFAYQIPTENVFCPTGEGGGIDPTCSPSGGGGSLTTKMSAKAADALMEDVIKELQVSEEDRCTYGACVWVSGRVAQKLLDRGYDDFKAIDGYVFTGDDEMETAHSWLEFKGGRIFDPTAAQFGEQEVHYPRAVEMERKGDANFIGSGEEFIEYLKEEMGMDMTSNVFCPTGEGGGIDPTCSPGGGGGVEALSKFSRPMSRDELPRTVFRTDRAHSAYKGKAVFGDGLYVGIDRDQVGGMTLDPDREADAEDEPDWESVEEFKFPLATRVLEIDADSMPTELSGEELKAAVLEMGYDALHVKSDSLNFGGDQIVIYRHPFGGPPKLKKAGSW